jgi:hypothetical protein
MIKLKQIFTNTHDTHVTGTRRSGILEWGRRRQPFCFVCVGEWGWGGKPSPLGKFLVLSLAQSRGNGIVFASLNVSYKLALKQGNSVNISKLQ